MQLRVPETMAAGTKVKCPKCAVTFQTPDPTAAAPPPLPGSPDTYTAAPPPPVLGYDAPHFQRPGWEAPPEFAGLDGDGPAYPRRRGIDDLSPAYVIDLNAMFSQAQAHWGNVLGPMIGYIILGGIVGFIAQTVLGLIPLIGPLIYFLMIDPQLQAGYTIVGLKELRRRPWEFGDFWSGFNFFGPLLLLRLLAILIVIACIAPGLIMMIAVERARNDVLSLMAGGLLLAGVGVFVYVAVRAFTFAVPLIVDRQCGAIDALTGSWRLTEGHFLGWLGIGILCGLLVLAGVMMCLVGVLFAQPLAVLVGVAGYLQVAGGRNRLEETGPL